MKLIFCINVSLFSVIIVISAVRCMIYQHKLLRYLLENHTEKWEELTTFLGFGPGYTNGFRGMKFLFGKDYLNDSEVLRMKVIVRNSFIYAIVGAVAMFFTMFLILLFHEILYKPV